jgi:hypothetical protein
MCLSLSIIAGRNVILICLQALGIYPLARQTSICTYFLYHATDFDTLNVHIAIKIIVFLITIYPNV